MAVAVAFASGVLARFAVSVPGATAAPLMRWYSLG
jgi:hypothetical protein